MILIEQHPKGYALRRTDTPDAEPIIVTPRELARMVAEIFDDIRLEQSIGAADADLGGYARGWDQMALAAQA